MVKTLQFQTYSNTVTVSVFEHSKDWQELSSDQRIKGSSALREHQNKKQNKNKKQKISVCMNDLKKIPFFMMPTPVTPINFEDTTL